MEPETHRIYFQNLESLALSRSSLVRIVSALGMGDADLDLDLEEADDELEEDEEEELDLLSGDLDLSLLSISESEFNRLIKCKQIFKGLYIGTEI